jgi:hypothetical protein
MGLDDFGALKPMKSTAVAWLPFVGDYRTFLMRTEDLPVFEAS